MNFPNLIELETPRLKLRLSNPESYNQLLEQGSDADIGAWFGYTTADEVTRERTRHQEGMTMAGRSFALFYLVEKLSGRTLGWCGYHTWFTLHRRAEIGYILNHDADKGKGYMREALPPIIRYGFENMNLHRIEALVGSENQPSLKLVAKHGFQREGLLREHYFRNGVYEDSIIFSLLRKEYLV